MHVDDQEFVYQGLSVTYKFRRSLQDRRHLLVVFSGGFGENKRYDLDGSVVDGIRTDILWIRDRFDGDFSYYIRTHRRGTLVAEAVAALIEKVRVERGLEKQHCTFLGFSKGASGALYHALVDDYPNVIAVVPRMRIGSGNRRLRPHVIKQLIGKDTDEGVLELDSLLPSLLASDRNMARNLYLFTSEADPQYKTDIAPFVSDFERYENFNFIVTDSPLVVRHRDVGSYNVPLLLATIAALGEGAVPRYGRVRNGTGAFTSSVPLPRIESVRERGETVCRMTSLALKDGRFYPEGLLFIKGMDTKDPGPLSRKLVLASEAGRTNYPLENVWDDRLNRTYFENEFCDYSHGKFSSPQRAGFDLSELPEGRHTLVLELDHGGVSVTLDEVPADPRDSALVTGQHLVRLRSNGMAVELLKGSVLADRMPGSYFKLGTTWAHGNTVHVAGRYVLPGVRTLRRNDLRYYLVLTHVGTRSAASAHQLATSRRVFPGDKVGDPLGDYRFTSFGTRSGEGIALNDAAPGEYDVYITALAGSIASSHPTGLRLTVTGEGDTMDCRMRASGAVSGGRIATDWVLTRPRLARRIRRDLGRIKRRILAVKR